MICEEVAQLLPDLVDGTLPEAIRAEVEAALPGCPECQQQLEISRRIRALLVSLQADNSLIRLPSGFETRVLARIHRQKNGLELLDLSSKALAEWLVEVINLMGGLIDALGANPPSIYGEKVL
jgi:anti-sigma factor RsiW